MLPTTRAFGDYGPGLFQTDRDFLNDLLRRVAASFEITPSQYSLAEGRYHGVAKWLSDIGSPLAAYEPIIYPQGSMALGTTNRPMGRIEFDLDLVMELVSPSYQFTPQELLSLLESRLRQSPNYRGLIELKARCVRLNYAGDFHMDILPAIPDNVRADTSILVPDRKNGGPGDWKPSNPKGYVKWFEDRAAQGRWAEIFEAMRAEIEPLPDQVHLYEKPPLKVAVQLMKRHRDVAFARNPDRGPISIVLTTLAGDHYQGEADLWTAMRDLLTGVLGTVQREGNQLEVRNPANPGEVLSEKWQEDPSLLVEFRLWVAEFVDFVDRLARADRATLHGLLIEMFGKERANWAIESQAQAYREARSEGLLGVTPGGLLVVGSGREDLTPVREHKFYGA
jgi:hypothetical protein